MKLPRLMDIADKLECLSTTERQILCDSLFLTINWFREVVFIVKFFFVKYFFSSHNFVWVDKLDT